MITFLPVSRYRMDYQVAAGRPYSLFERLLLEAIAERGSSIEVMEETFRVHRRMIIEGVVTLMQAGWVTASSDGSTFVATPQGKGAVKNPGELPRNIVVSKRFDFLVGERVEGQLVTGNEVKFWPRSELKPYWERGVAIPKSDVPHPSEPGVVIPLLRRQPGEWIRWCDAISVVRDGADFLVIDVDIDKEVITGLPRRWEPLLREQLLERARKKDRELARSGKTAEDKGLQRFVRRAEEAEATHDLDEWLLDQERNPWLVGSTAHREILVDRIQNAHSYLAMISGGVSRGGIEPILEHLRAAVLERGVVVDVLWRDEQSKEGLDLLKKIAYDSKRAGGKGRLSVAKTPVKTRATMLISDTKEGFEAFVGSFDWLSRKGDVEPRALSLSFVEPLPLARIFGLFADILTNDPGLSTGAGVMRLRNEAAAMDRRASELDKVSVGALRARMVMGRQLRAVIGTLAKQAETRMVLGARAWSSDAAPTFKVLLEVVKSGCPRVEARIGLASNKEDVQRMGAELVKAGGVLEGEQAPYLNFAVCNDNIAAISSFNWLSPSEVDAADVGFILRGEGQGAHLLRSVGLSEAPSKERQAERQAMYVTDLRVSNLKSIEHLVWSVPSERAPGWHVLVGDNGSGKSTILRALALSLVGAEEAAALRQDWRTWLREEDPTKSRVDVTLSSNTASKISLSWSKDEERVTLKEVEEGAAARRVEGFFSAAYGPFRRFAGGDPEYEKQISAFPALSRHLSMFDERVALTEGLAWLKELRFRELERDHHASALLRDIIALINESKLLPNGAKLVEVTSAAVVFTDGHEHQFAIEELSDGYRSVLSLTLDILRRLAMAYGHDRVFDPGRAGVVVAPGVVLIDEVDAHLHPSWQRTVGQWFCDHFPRVQFIVASHSALVCQASERGTVYRLPSPNNEADDGGMLHGADLDRLVYGNILEAYASGAFGLGVTRSESAKKLLRRLAELNQQELSSALTEPEREEQARLRAMFPTQSNIPQGKG